MKREMLLTYLLLSTVCVPGALPKTTESAERESPLKRYVNPVTYEVTQRITVNNGDVSALDLLELNLPIPLDWPEQKIARLEITGDRTFRLRDVNGLGLVVRSLYSEPERLPGPGDSRSLALTYRVTRQEVRTDAEALATRTYRPFDKESPDFLLYTQSEKLIESDAAEIVDLAAKLNAEAIGPYRFARAAYDYVVEHTEYVSPSPSHGARECLLKGKADCGSYTALFVALCRARGLPARPVAGCWAKGENQWHCWAEFLLPDVGWIPVDPSVGDRGPHEREFYFGNLDNNRVALAKTFNLTVDTTRGSTDLGFAQVGTWWWYPAPGSTGSRMAVSHELVGKNALR